MDLLADVVSQANFSPLPPVESSDTDKKTPFQPHKILYPAPNGEEKWVGLNPLDMVQQIVSIAENTAIYHMDPRSSSSRQLLQTITNPQLNEAASGGKNEGKKRKSRRDDENEDASLENDGLVLALIDSVDVSPVDDTFKTWTPSSSVSLEESVIYSGLDGWITRLEPVAKHSRNKWVLPSYNRVQQQFQSSVSKGDDVLVAIKIATSQMMTLAGMLCESPVPTPKPLLEVKSAPVVSFEAPAAKPVMKNKMLPADAFQHYMDFWLKTNWINPFPDEAMNLALANFLLSTGSIVLTPKDKASLVDLNAEQHKQQLINIAMEKMSNWLVNNRTRRWRPALQDAFDGRRPAALLYEDSKRIYEEIPLRPLVNWDSYRLFMFDPKYLTKVKTWAKPSKRGAKGKKKAVKDDDDGYTPPPATRRKRTVVQTRPLPSINHNMPPPLDHSPCSAFLNAGTPMQLDEDEGDGLQMTAV